MTLFGDLKNALARRHLGDPPIQLHDQGFLVGGRPVLWSDVTEIRAYKIDALTVDELRLVFALGNSDWVEVSEEQAGFLELTDAMTHQFPSTADWHRRVAYPPFATNETVLYAVV